LVFAAAIAQAPMLLHHGEQAPHPEEVCRVSEDRQIYHGLPKDGFQELLQLTVITQPAWLEVSGNHEIFFGNRFY
jgi:predicted transposase YdaD